MLEFIEKALGQIAVSLEERAESRDAGSLRHSADIWGFSFARDCRTHFCPHRKSLVLISKFGSRFLFYDDFLRVKCSI